jgi:hypothetical protein
MKLFVGDTQLCFEVKNWDVEKYGYIDHIMLIYNEKDDDGRYINEVIKGPFIVHHFDMIKGSVTFAHVNQDNEYVPDGLAVTITKNILNKVLNVFIAIDNTNIHLFSHTCTINPEISKIWEECEKDNSEMYLKYHDPKRDKNMLVHVRDMYTRSLNVDYVNDFEYCRDNLPKSEEYLDLDVETIVW